MPTKDPVKIKEQQRRYRERHREQLREKNNRRTLLFGRGRRFLEPVSLAAWCAHLRWDRLRYAVREEARREHRYDSMVREFERYEE
jgi:hypothetical protein